jgi:molecular chaperone GrpE
MNRINHEIILNPTFAMVRRDFSFRRNVWNQEQQQEQEERERKQEEEKLQEKTAQEQDKQQSTEQTSENEIEQLKEKLKLAEEKAKEYENKYKASLAEMQNVRRIAKNDVENEKKYAITKFATNLLDVADNFERALHAITLKDVEKIVNFLTDEKVNADEELVKKARTLKTVFEGVQRTEVILHKIFASFGIEKMLDVEGSQFNPAVHDAVVKQTLKEGEDASKANSVTHVLKTGYLMKDRVLRPAQVVVVTHD